MSNSKLFDRQNKVQYTLCWWKVSISITADSNNNNMTHHCDSSIICKVFTETLSVMYFKCYVHCIVVLFVHKCGWHSKIVGSNTRKFRGVHARAARIWQYAWTRQGDVVVVKGGGSKYKLYLSSLCLCLCLSVCLSALCLCLCLWVHRLSCLSWWTVARTVAVSPSPSPSGWYYTHE